EQSHRHSLAERRSRAVSERHASDKETDAVVYGVAKKVEGVGLQGNRSGAKTRDHLDDEHGQIDTQDDPEHAPIGSTSTPLYHRRMAAGFTHLNFSQSLAYRL